MEAKQFDEIFHLVSALEEISDYDKSLEIITNHVSKKFNAGEASVIMINPRTDNTVKTIFSNNKDSRQINIKLLHNLVSGWILKNKKSFISGESQANDIIEQESQGLSILSAPLKNSGKIIGIFFLIADNNDKNTTGTI